MKTLPTDELVARLRDRRKRAARTSPGPDTIGKQVLTGQIDSAMKAALNREYLRGRTDALDEVIRMLTEKPEPGPTPMTDEELLAYADIHCETERALFSVDHIRRLFALAGKPEPEIPTTGFLACKQDVIHPLTKAARERLSA
jgi:hypothetical protein